MHRFTTLLILLISCTAPAKAQGFKPYLTLGSNVTKDYFTQAGSSQVGTRLGLVLGPGVLANLNERWDLGAELLYSQNGFYTDFIQVPNTPINKIKLHYIEAPLRLHYRLGKDEGGDKSRKTQSIGFGVSYAHLFSSKFLAADETELTDEVFYNGESTLLYNLYLSSSLGESFTVSGWGAVSGFGEWTFTARVLYFL